MSVEQVGLLPHDLLVQRLEAHVPRHVRTDLRGSELRHVGLDEHGVARRRREQLRLTRPFHGDEPPRRLVDRVPDREEPVVAQDDGLLVAQRVRKPLALLEIEDAWAAAITSGRAAWTCEWMTNAAVLTP